MLSSISRIKGAVDKIVNIRLALNMLNGLVVNTGSKLPKSNSLASKIVFRKISIKLIINNTCATYTILEVLLGLKKAAKNIKGRQEIIDGVNGRK